jgi:YegS/Rv2252/BmrU family lipid kinase
MRSETWLVVVNVFAASKKAGSVWKKAATCLEMAGVPYKAEFTGGKYNATELSRKGAERGYRKFIAIGGDGTVHDVLNGISEYAANGISLSEFTLAVLPVGSGNDWVKSVGISKDVKGAVAAIAAGNVGKQDVVKVSILDTSDMSGEPLAVSYMSNVGGVGIDARVCEIVNRQKEQGKRGKKLYISALAYCIRHRVPIRAKVVCDGNEIFAGKYFSIAFGIGKYSGGGMRQTPEAVLDDGLLDVTVIPDISMWVIAKEVYKLFTGKFLTIKQLTAAKCKEVYILPEGESDSELVEVDGEVVGRAPVKMEILDQQINIIRPA